MQQVSKVRAQRLQRRVYKHTTSSRVRSKEMPGFHEKKKEMRVFNRTTVHLISEAEIVYFSQGFSKHSTMKHLEEHFHTDVCTKQQCAKRIKKAYNHGLLEI